MQCCHGFVVYVLICNVRLQENQSIMQHDLGHLQLMAMYPPLSQSGMPWSQLWYLGRIDTRPLPNQLSYKVSKKWETNFYWKIKRILQEIKKKVITINFG